ncbi:DMT family transporter [Variovorax ginsengisoli]|uniref:Drug/metabolite transporter (DMT)-like permease n=1 Tax=Variovorax ginsengisoli TaxID=363844 RepID=A0ABT9S8A7_9BURK|nr:DMT family transporter [Variovorax ginsengisoli]MDP9899612.1 drug/metabolite transporter (DMT)-like permease [Variovorax ginsengisoli]
MNSRNMRTDFGRAEFMLLGVAAIWGGSYAVAKQALLQVPVLEFLCLRFGLTFVLLLPALRPLFQGQARRCLMVGCILGANLMAVFVCETWGVTLTTASHAAFLISLCVAFTPLVEWWMLGRRPTARVVAAVALALAGAALLSAKSNVSSGTTAFGWGDALMVGAAVLRALMVCLTQRLAGTQAVPALTLTALQSGLIAAGVAVLAWITPSPAWVGLPSGLDFWGQVAFLVLGCTLFAFYAQNHAASRTSPSRVSLLMGSEPAFGAMVAVLWLGEDVSPLGWAGGAMIVAAAVWVTLPQSQPRRYALPVIGATRARRR